MRGTQSIPRTTLVGMFGVVLAMAPSSGTGQDLPRVIMQTDLGAIEIEIDTVRAPVTGANFLRYVDAEYYTPGRFHRTVTPDNQPNNDVRIEVIQGGMEPGRGLSAFAPIALERTNVTGLAHRNGAISVARGAPDSGRSDFFICIGDQPELDFGGKRNADGQGFAAFGRVVRGMDVVRRIQASNADGQRLTPPVAILSTHRKE